MDMSKVPAMQDCIQACLRCYQNCLGTMQYCLQQGGEHTDPHHLKQMQTCAEVSRACAALMIIQSPHYVKLCLLCSTVCHECAKSCEAFRDEAMEACAQTCRSCAEICQDMTRAAL